MTDPNDIPDNNERDRQLGMLAASVFLYLDAKDHGSSPATILRRELRMRSILLAIRPQWRINLHEPERIIQELSPCKASWHKEPQAMGESCPDCGGNLWSFDPLG